MKDYLDELLDYYDIKRTDKKGIWVKTKDGNIVPFDYNEGDGKMSNKIKIKKSYFIASNNTWEWYFEILDKDLELKGRSYEILSYKNDTEYIYIKYFYNGSYKSYDTGKCLSEKELDELQSYIDEDINITNKYYYIYLSSYDNNAVYASVDDNTNIDKQRKAMGNYFKTYKQAEEVWNKIKQILKESK